MPNFAGGTSNTKHNTFARPGSDVPCLPASIHNAASGITRVWPRPRRGSQRFSCKRRWQQRRQYLQWGMMGGAAQVSAAIVALGIVDHRCAGVTCGPCGIIVLGKAGVDARSGEAVAETCTGSSSRRGCHLCSGRRGPLRARWSRAGECPITQPRPTSLAESNCELSVAITAAASVQKQGSQPTGEPRDNAQARRPRASGSFTRRVQLPWTSASGKAAASTTLESGRAHPAVR